MRSLCLLGLSSAVLLGAAAPARAGDRNELTLGTWNRALRSDSANAITATAASGRA